MNQTQASSPITGGTIAPATSGFRYAFLHAMWHADIVLRGRDAFLAELARQNVPRSHVDVIELPGAFEIPLHAQALARAGQHAAIVACALVVDGGIYRHEFVSEAVISGLMRVQLDTGVPVISAVLTPKNYHEHADHQKFFAEHFVIKGTEAAQACLRTVQSLRRIPRD